MAGKNSLILVIPALAILLLSQAAASSKGSVALELTSPVSLNGTEIKAGQYLVHWVSHSPEAEVKFSRSGRVAVEARGRFVERDEIATHTMVIVRVDSGGKKAVSEIRFKGKKTALVFEE